MSSDASRTILLIEDDQDIRELEKFLLESLGYQVTTACNGREAFERLCDRERPCLILLDLMMPDMNGWEFLEERARTRTACEVPVVIVSAIAGLQSPAESLAKAVLTKPFSFDRLVSAVRSHCLPCES